MPTPTATPTSTAAPVVEETPGQAVTPVALMQVRPALLDVRRSVTLTLPAGWEEVALENDQLRGSLAKISWGAAAGRQVAAAGLLAGMSEEATALLARTASTNAEQPPTSVMVVAVERNDLTLNRYLDDVVVGLRAQGVQVEKAGLTAALRRDGLPVATIHYRMAQMSGDPSTELAGYQVAALDASATQLIIFTFTTPAAQWGEQLARFDEIIRTADF
jgi:hypothetical protein